ncbi:26S proteasome complex subunit SEM1-like [Dysidea avara]|uniref:26S proteasome complex subunit SEM1-like n=1 Tax=Dysidea avara TaxID=196820 RepID=UPI00332E45C4
MAVTNKVTKNEQALLEDDDDFEEFPTEDWTTADEDAEDTQMWEDNWDDDNVEDDFSMQLRAELEKLGHKVLQPEAMKT